MIAPTFEPELNSAVAYARSPGGNQSATTLIADGKFPPSPTPSAKRAVRKPLIVPTSACPMAATLQAAIETAYPTLVPTRSMNAPNDQQADRVRRLKGRVDHAELLVGPPKLDVQEWLHQRQNLSVDVVNRRCKEQQTAYDPAVTTNMRSMTRQHRRGQKVGGRCRALWNGDLVARGAGIGLGGCWGRAQVCSFGGDSVIMLLPIGLHNAVLCNSY